ncbi:MAG: FMN-binding negative transcriptional regulator [Vibrio sp.]
MYIPANTRLDDRQAIAHIINEHGFGLLISSRLNATHLPMLYQTSKDGFGELYGHFAKANPHSRELDGERVLVIFNGPHAYISPAWYATQPAVPTWNYVAVHCYGTVQLLEEPENSLALDQLIQRYEPELLADNDIMPNEFKTKLRSGIVGFKIVLDDIQAKEKLGQHRSEADQQGVYQALRHSDHDGAQALAAYMKQRELGTGNSDVTL